MQRFAMRAGLLALVLLAAAGLPGFGAQGTFAGEGAARGVAVKPLPAVNPAGRQWLILIGIDDYADNRVAPDLKSCKADMEALRDLLISRFGYRRENVVELYDLDATARNIQRTIYDMLKKVGENDTVIIAYAGHGYYDKDTRLGWWFPSDTESPADGIPNSTVRDWCAAFKAKKVLVIADSCFSGSLLSREGFTEDATLKSREILAAGGLQPVADSGSPDGLHSVFNHYLRAALTRLADQGKPFVTNDLYVDLYTPVKANSSQEPQKGIMEGAFHEGGQFLFYPSGAAARPVKPVTAPAAGLPSPGGMQFDDIEKAAEEQRKARESWAAWQAERTREYEKVDAYDKDEALTPDQKAEAWDRMLAVLAQENPYSVDDDSMREHARIRRDHWKEEAAKALTPAPAQAPGAAKGAGAPTPENSVGMKFVYCPPGTFMMGSPESEPGHSSEESPQHRVNLTRGFFMQVTEVTQGQWKAVMGTNPSHYKDCGDECPLERVTWYDVQEFLKRLNELENTTRYRLPTEAEWEYACRAGSTTAYYWGKGDGIGDYAWYSENSGGTTHPVARKLPNAWGLYDMSGNVWEWCSDIYDVGYYASAPPENDPPGPGPDAGSGHVSRGGSWCFEASMLRSALRFGLPADYSESNLGFRVVADIVY